VTGALGGIMAIAVDGGALLDQHRNAHSVADAAAMAAAVELYQNYPTNTGTDPLGTAKNSALNTASKLGYTNDGTRSVVTVNIPPLAGDHIGQAGYVEVIVQYNQPRYFSRLFGASDLPVMARAVARGRWASGKDGILVLDLTASEALKANGTGTVFVTGADLIVNSNNPQAVGGDGTGTIISDTGGVIKLSGGVKSGTTLIGTVQYNQVPTPDPLAYLPEPSLPSASNSVKSYKSNNPTVAPYLAALSIDPTTVNGRVYLLQPGRYDSLPNFSNGDVIILQQASTNGGNGVYYLNNSGFTSTGATIKMDPFSSGGVMFYNDPSQNSAGISITGGNVTIWPMTSGIYTGISFFQNRASSVALSITGQGSMNISGTFYVAGGPISITGSSATSLDVIGSQYISDTLQSGGNGSYQVNWDPQKTARLRQLCLVE
jgi:hypothetical protein